MQWIFNSIITLVLYLAGVSAAAATRQLVAGGGRVHDGDVEVARAGQALHRERVRHRARLQENNRVATLVSNVRDDSSFI